MVIQIFSSFCSKYGQEGQFNMHHMHLIDVCLTPHYHRVDFIAGTWKATENSDALSEVKKYL